MQVMVNGIPVNYLAKGNAKKPSVLFLHGWGTSASIWEDMMRRVADVGYYCIALDFPTPEEVWRVDDYAGFVDEFLSSIGVRPMAVVGHSFGGRVMLKNQFDARGLVFIDSAGVKPKSNAIKNFIAKIGKKIIPKKIHNSFGSIDYKLLKGNMRETFRNVVGEDLVPYMKNIKQPTLLVWGDRDEETPVSDALVFEKNIRNADLKIIKNASHYSFLGGDNPDEVTPLVIDFLEGIDA